MDGTDIRDTISELDPETTLIIISSKTFTTTETLMNAKIAINWLETSLNTTGVESTNHIIGITANTENGNTTLLGKIKIALFGGYKFPRILQKHTS